MAPSKSDRSHTSSSLGATLKSPSTAKGRGPAASSATAARSASNHSSLYAKCACPTSRPLGTYTDQTRTGPQVAETERGSSTPSYSGPPGSPVTTSSRPTFDSSATPFHLPVALTAAS
ncbi:hypothetical protein M2266_005664 [Streptomyces sp. SPB162]|nr:hypothetical protein [Streptomyces sp. SPB162]